MSFNIFATATSDIPLANLDANFTMIGSSAVASTLYPTATTSITYGTTGTIHYFSGSGLAVTGTLSATGLVTLTGTSAGNALQMTASASGTRGDAAYQTWFRANGSTRKGYFGFASADTANISLGVEEAGGSFLVAGNTSITGTLSANNVDATILTLQRNGGTDTNTAIRFQGASTSYYIGRNTSGGLGFSYNAADVSGSAQMTLDSSGNLGLGVTPSAWQVNNRALEIYGGWASISGNNSQGCCDVSSNCYNSTAQAILGWKYTNSSSLASLYQQSAGVHKWLTAPSGTAGDAITFTQAMTLDASGNLRLGPLATDFTFTNGSAVNLSGSGTGIAGNGTNLTLGAWNGPIIFQAGNSAGALVERARINSSGNLLVGATTNPNSCFVLVKSTNGDQLDLDNDGSRFTSFYLSNNGTAKVSSYWDNTNAYYKIVPVTNGVYLSSGGVAWVAVSDERFKDIIEPIENATDKLSGLRAIVGKYKTDEEGIRRSFLIAQDVQAVFPEAVDSTNQDELGLRYQDLIPVLVKAIQELSAKVTALEAK